MYLKMLFRAQFKVTITGNEREFYFKAESAEEASLWVTVINEHI